jgi:putative PIN family toxin of toxin-antitoxin system
MYRVILDPAVLIAALISARGAPRALLAAWMDGAFELLVSPKVLGELARVLKRPKVRPYVRDHEARAFIALLERFATVCPDAASPPRVAPDARGAYLFALARSQAADFLVSGDAHLCRLKNTQPPVLTPRSFLNRLK